MAVSGRVQVPVAFSLLLLFLWAIRVKNYVVARRIMVWLRRYIAWSMRHPGTAAVKSATSLTLLSAAMVLVQHRGTVASRLMEVSQSVGATVSSAGSTTLAAFRPENVRRKAVGAVSQATRSVTGKVSVHSGKIVSAVSNGLSSASEKLRSSVEAVYESRLNAVERHLEGYIGQATTYAGEGLKGSLKDPAMPDVVKQLIDETVDKVIPDVRSTAVALTSMVSSCRTIPADTV